MRGIWDRFRALDTKWQVAIGAVIVILLVGAIGGSDDDSDVDTSSDDVTTTTTAAVDKPDDPEDEPDDRPGNPDVYERIETSTDCVALQAEFDTAMDNVERYEAGSPEREVPMAYAEAANDRIEELGC